MSAAVQILVAKLDGPKAIALGAAEALLDVARDRRCDLDPYVMDFCLRLGAGDVDVASALANALGKWGSDTAVSTLGAATKTMDAMRLLQPASYSCFSKEPLSYWLVTSIADPQTATSAVVLSGIIQKQSLPSPVRSLALKELSQFIGKFPDAASVVNDVKALALEYASSNDPAVAEGALAFLGATAGLGDDSLPTTPFPGRLEEEEPPNVGESSAGGGGLESISSSFATLLRLQPDVFPQALAAQLTSAELTDLSERLARLIPTDSFGSTESNQVPANRSIESRHPLADLTSLCTTGDREAIYTAVVAMVHSDELLQEEERSFLRDTCELLDLPQDWAKGLEEQARAKKLKVKVPKRPLTRTLLLHHVLQAAAADGHIDSSERRFAERLGELIGVTGDQVQAVLEKRAIRVREETASDSSFQPCLQPPQSQPLATSSSEIDVRSELSALSDEELARAVAQNSQDPSLVAAQILALVAPSPTNCEPQPLLTGADLPPDNKALQGKATAWARAWATTGEDHVSEVAVRYATQNKKTSFGSSYSFGLAIRLRTDCGWKWIRPIEEEGGVTLVFGNQNSIPTGILTALLHAIGSTYAEVAPTLGKAWWEHRLQRPGDVLCADAPCGKWAKPGERCSSCSEWDED
jgi:hypothetical protein